MNHKDAQRILSSARPADLDSDDPDIRAALKFVRQDPELTAWWAKEQAFDEVFRRKLSELKAPPSLKESLLRIKPAPEEETDDTPQKTSAPIPFTLPKPPTPWWKNSRMLSVAASIILVLGFIALFLNPKTLEAEDNELLAFYDSLSDQIDQSETWKAQGRDWQGIADYLNEHNAPTPDHIAEKLPRDAGLRATTANWKGTRVTLVAIQTQDKLYLAVIPAQAFPESRSWKQPQSHHYRGMNWHASTDRDYLFVFIFTGPVDETRILF